MTEQTLDDLQQIHVPGLLLRPFVDSDAPAFAAAALESVETVGRWMPWCHAGFGAETALAWFAACRSGREAGSAYEFGVFDAASGELVGGVGLNLINLQHRYCNLGYWVRQSRQGQGIATRCVPALTQLAFGMLALHRIEIVVAAGNAASERVALKCGATFEALARKRLLLHGEPVSASIFSIVAP